MSVSEIVNISIMIHGRNTVSSYVQPLAQNCIRTRSKNKAMTMTFSKLGGFQFTKDEPLYNYASLISIYNIYEVLLFSNKSQVHSGMRACTQNLTSTTLQKN